MVARAVLVRYSGRMHLNWWCLHCNKKGNCAIPETGAIQLARVYADIASQHGGNVMAVSISFIAEEPATIRKSETGALVLESSGDRNPYHTFEVRHVQ